MSTSLKTFLIELAWLLAALILTYVLAGFLFNWRFAHTIDLHLSDTYYVIAPLLFLLPFFSMICFIVFVLKEVRNKFSKKIPGIIIICAGVAFIITLSRLVKFMPVISGTTQYPALSALSDNWVNVGYDHEMSVLFDITIGIQAIV